MTKIDIKDEDVVPYGIVKNADSSVTKKFDNSLIATVLIIKTNNNLVDTLNSVKEVSNTFVIFNNTKDSSLVKDFCKTNNINLFLQEKEGEITDEYRNQLLKFADDSLTDKTNKKSDKYLLLMEEGDILTTPDNLIKFVEENKKGTQCYALRCQYPVQAGVMYIRLIKSHKGLKFKNGLINIAQAKNQPPKDVVTLENIILKMHWNKQLMALVMMVKNEHLRLEYSFDSVKDFTDTFIILDTGSTDNTIDICRQYCKKNNINLYLKEEPFVNFEVSRNDSLDWADEALTKNGKKEERYLLFLDCNDELKSGPELMMFIHTYQGPATGYFLKQQWWSGNKFDSYFNIRMVKAHKGWRYKGVVHEYIRTNIKEYDIKERLEHIILFQDRTKDDDKSQKRFSRDKALLFDAHLKNPEDPRTIFYLAQTCGCLQQMNEAYKYYLLRIKYQGFREENYHAYIRLGELALSLRHPWEESQTWFLKAYAHSARAEPLTHLARRYMEYNIFNERKPDWLMAYMYANMACKLCYPVDQVLFVDKKVYTLDRWRILARCAYQVQQYKEGKEAIIKALMYGKGNGKFGLLNNGEKSSIELTLKQRINEMNEKDKTSDWNSDLQLLAEYLKMDSEIGVAIQQGAVPNFKTLTYIVHDKARFIPAAEGMPDNTFTAQEVLGEATRIAIQRLK